MYFRFAVFSPTDTDQKVPISLSPVHLGKKLRHKEHHPVCAGPLGTGMLITP